MRVFQEEIFGPVISVALYDTEDEAAALHDATDFGLERQRVQHRHRTRHGLRPPHSHEARSHQRRARPPNVDLVRSFYKHSSLGGSMDLVPGYPLIKSIPRG